jgi:ABC-type nitrate/sulfonate/bicarbonate transport system substrate-binding protein
MIKTMVEGTIDAALCWPPHTTEIAKQLGPMGARRPAQSGQDYYFALSTKEGFLKKQPKTMERFLAGLLDAEAFWQKYQTSTTIPVRLKGVQAFSDPWSHSRFQLQLSRTCSSSWNRRRSGRCSKKLVKENLPNFLDFFYFHAR